MMVSMFLINETAPGCIARLVQREGLDWECIHLCLQHESWNEYATDC